MSSRNPQQRPLWTHPDPSGTSIDAFRCYINKKYSLSLSGYSDIWEWSVADVGVFSSELMHFCGIVFTGSLSLDGQRFDKMWPRPRWFPNAKLNYTENLLLHASRLHNRTAISACREGGTDWRHLTWAQLYSAVGLWVDALRSHGITKGDRVAVVMTNCIETIVLLLACGAIGAIFSSTSPDIGELGIIQRYKQIKPKILFVETTVLYNRKRIDLRERISNVAQELSRTAGLERLIFCQGPHVEVPGVLTATISEFLSTVDRSHPLEFEQLPFDHPIYIVYSSGTTGPPKCICHSSGGALLQQKKELIMSYSLGENDCYYQYTTVGWMMWNYVIAALSCGTRLVLYDGNPTVPNCISQLEMIESQGVTMWGTSPKFLEALKSECLQGQLPTSVGLKLLKSVASSGAPLTHEMFEWFYEVFPNEIGLFSGSGGTDLVGGIVMGTPLLPIYTGEIQACALGMKVEIWDIEGGNIEDSGEPGDLVITKPFLSMPTTFWGNDGEQKYFSAYFDRYPGVWYHGDFMKKKVATGGYEILGRSDGVLNPGGVRFGSAELYNVIGRFKRDVLDCIVVGRRRPGDSDEVVMMFLKLTPDLTLTPSLVASIRKAIGTSLSPRHVPKFILQVQDVPYTANGKKVENAVKAIVSGRNLVTSGTVVNPECLDEYRKFVDLGGAPRVSAKI